MKKIILFVLLAVGTLVAQAQHLEFKGHPITGKLSDFVALLKKDGFATYGSKQCTTATDRKQLQNAERELLKKHLFKMEGHFLDKDVSVVIGASKTDTVYMVSVNFENDCSEKWSKIEKFFNEIESLLSEKYGEPYSQKTGSEFSEAIKLLALSQNKMAWMSTFELQTGDVLLAILPCKSGYRDGAHLKLIYTDKENYETHKKQKKERLLNDL